MLKEAALFNHNVAPYHVFPNPKELMLYFVSNHSVSITHCNYYLMPDTMNFTANGDVESTPNDVCNVCSVV